MLWHSVMSFWSLVYGVISPCPLSNRATRQELLLCHAWSSRPFCFVVFFSCLFVCLAYRCGMVYGLISLCLSWRPTKLQHKLWAAQLVDSSCPLLGLLWSRSPKKFGVGILQSACFEVVYVVDSTCRVRQECDTWLVDTWLVDDAMSGLRYLLGISHWDLVYGQIGYCTTELWNTGQDPLLALSGLYSRVCVWVCVFVLVCECVCVSVYANKGGINDI